jgi:hypothetical protein
MTRFLWYLALLAAGIAALAALPAEGYQFLSQQVPGVAGVLPDRWQALPINLTVDNGPTDVLAEVNSAVATWNAVPTANDPFGTVTLASGDFNRDNLGTAWGNLTGDG